jgi:CubicO group peptidase (beta-lactamase class C family)
MMRKKVMFLFIFAILFPYLYQNVSANTESFTEEKLKKVDSYVREQFREAGIVGGAYAIISKDQILEAKGVGYSDLKLKERAKPETVYSIASVAKVLTATAILQLQEEGKLNINDPVQKYLPWFSYKDKEKSKLVTIGHLLTHAAGTNRFEADGSIFIDEEKNRKSLESSIRALRTVEMKYEPGLIGQYCNSCYNTLGLIIEKVSGVSYYEYMKSYIYRPLEMNMTVYGEELETIPAGELAKEYSWFFGFRNTKILNYQSFGKSQDPEGGVYTNVIDLAKYLSASLGYGSLLKKDTLLESYKGIVPAEHVPWEYTHSGFELSTVSNKRTLYKGGDGIGSNAVMMMMPEEQIGIVLIIGESNSEPKQAIAKGMLQILIGETPENIQFPPPPFKIIGIIMFVISMISFLSLGWICLSFYRRLIKKNRTVKRQWVSILISLILMIPLLFIVYLFVEVRPTQIGFYGYPYDMAFGLLILAFTLFVSFAYHIYLIIFGKEQIQKEEAI